MPPEGMFRFVDFVLLFRAFVAEHRLGLTSTLDEDLPQPGAIHAEDG